MNTRRDGFRDLKGPDRDPCPREEEGAKEDDGLALDSDGAEFKQPSWASPFPSPRLLSHLSNRSDNPIYGEPATRQALCYQSHGRELI